MMKTVFVGAAQDHQAAQVIFTDRNDYDRTRGALVAWKNKLVFFVAQLATKNLLQIQEARYFILSVFQAWRVYKIVLKRGA